MQGWIQTCWAWERFTTEKQPLQELVLLEDLVLLLCASHGVRCNSTESISHASRITKVEVHHGREKVNADGERAKSMIKIDNVQIKGKISAGMGFFSE